ncbi:conserved hypothetical protein [Candidatus Koribacter versatilis Ellin345]|uniref:Chemotaxis phosphatase CheX-like domain-containing protein n=1 Tax=Koribacter versatilis (strain Ellin345) TaxID=204669 RepID=Q1IMH8_KORVE|nr:chemotaxis protein CheX [Candidatus Koribacter versatilis]ABF41922.1 conserved hypothetical protein [Candidatus Koribacter versatilis Ellin345]
MQAVVTIADWAVLLEESTREVFGMMLGCEIESQGGDSHSTSSTDPEFVATTQEPVLQMLFRTDAHNSSGCSEVTAVVGIAGEVCGVLNFACDSCAARKIAARMLGIDEAEAGDQQFDAIGEICNMIAGNFKSKLPGIGEKCMLSVPTIVVGSNYRLRALSGKRRLEYRCLFESAPLRVALEVQQ